MTSVCLNGYRRNTTGLELIIEPTGSHRLKELLQTVGFEWNDETKTLRIVQSILMPYRTRLRSTSEFRSEDLVYITLSAR